MIIYLNKKDFFCNLECKKNGESKSILFNLCGHGHFDMKAYGDFFDGNLAEDLKNCQKLLNLKIDIFAEKASNLSKH